jgi:hypothetical protein
MQKFAFFLVFVTSLGKFRLNVLEFLSTFSGTVLCQSLECFVCKSSENAECHDLIDTYIKPQVKFIWFSHEITEIWTSMASQECIGRDLAWNENFACFTNKSWSEKMTLEIYSLFKHNLLCRQQPNRNSQKLPYREINFRRKLLSPGEISIL